ncbi:MAG: hypothetical protein IKV63_02955 [Clostridia bacterium]|nr:hypothetical protein [Clostridia bacterium]
MDKEQYSLEDILSEFSDHTSSKKTPSKAYDEIFKEDDISVPDFLSKRKKTPAEALRQNAEKAEKGESDDTNADVKVKPAKKQPEAGPAPQEEVKIYKSSIKKPKEAPAKAPAVETNVHTPHRDDEEFTYNDYQEKKPPERDEYDDYEEEEKPKKALPYDIISGFEEDFTLGAKHCSKKIIKYSALYGLSVPVAIVAIIVSFIHNFDLSGVPYIPELLALIQPFEPLILLACQGIAILLAIEIIVSGIYKCIMLAPNLDTVIALHSIVSCGYSVYTVLTQNYTYIPYTAISCFTLMMAIRSKRMKLIIHKRNYTASALSATPVAVKISATKGGYIATKAPLRSDVPCKNIAQMSCGESSSMIFVPFMLALPAILAALSCKSKGDFSTFLLDYAALTSVSLPFGFITASSRVEYKLSKKLFASGSAFVDNSKLRKVNQVRTAVITGSDVFPAGSVEITGMKVLGNNAIDTVIAYAAAIFEQVGGGAYKAFYDIGKSRYVNFRKAKNVHFYESGGISAVIGSDNVLLGNASFLMRMGVNITHGINVKNNIFLSVNSTVSAVFTIQFREAPNTYKAFRIFRRNKVKPVLASLDFQINPMLVEQTFDLSPNFIIYPDIDERIILSGSSYAEEEEPVALLSRDNMHSFAEILAYSKTLYRATRFNIIFSFLCLTFGLGLVYFLVSKNEFLVISPYNAFLYLLLWYIPVFLKNLFNGDF